MSHRWRVKIVAKYETEVEAKTHQEACAAAHRLDLKALDPSEKSAQVVEDIDGDLVWASITNGYRPPRGGELPTKPSEDVRVMVFNRRHGGTFTEKEVGLIEATVRTCILVEDRWNGAGTSTFSLLIGRRRADGGEPDEQDVSQIVRHINRRSRR